MTYKPLNAQFIRTMMRSNNSSINYRIVQPHVSLCLERVPLYPTCDPRNHVGRKVVTELEHHLKCTH